MNITKPYILGVVLALPFGLYHQSELLKIMKLRNQFQRIKFRHENMKLKLDPNLDPNHFHKMEKGYEKTWTYFALGALTLGGYNSYKMRKSLYKDIENLSEADVE